MNYAGCTRKFDVAAYVDKYPRARPAAKDAGGSDFAKLKKKGTKNAASGAMDQFLTKKKKARVDE